MNKLDSDPTAEISRFEIHLSMLGVVLLHEDLLTESLDDKCFLVPSSVKQMQTVANKFFDDSGAVLMLVDFKTIHNILDKCCQLNHLRYISTLFI